MPRILFVKTSSLGDVVHNWLVEESFAEIPALHGAVRRVIPVAVRRWRAALWRPGAWSEMRALRRLLRGERYDAVIDTQGLVKSALLGALAPGRRHGMDRASLREPLAAAWYHVRHPVARAQHAVARNRQLAAAALGYAVPESCDYGLRAGGVAPGGDQVVFLTMSSRADKLWPEGRWIELGRSLAGRGLRALLPWGSGAERERCVRLAAAIPGAQVPDRMPLGQLARLLRGARAVAGVDTGLSHLAVAVGAAVIGIYTATDPALTGLYGNPRVRNLGAAGAPPAAAQVLAGFEELM
jgi:heptosyltransferase I